MNNYKTSNKNIISEGYYDNDVLLHSYVPILRIDCAV